MTEKEEQQSGQLYDPTAPDIRRMREHGSALARRYNSCDDHENGAEILKMLFAEIGENVRVNRPFLTDFGCHTHIGDDTVINLSCTFLDAADIHIKYPRKKRSSGDILYYSEFAVEYLLSLVVVA